MLQHYFGTVVRYASNPRCIASISQVIYLRLWEYVSSFVYSIY